MRKRYVTYRLTAAEYQNLKAEAEKAGASVPLHARRLALDGVQIGPRLEAIEQLIRAVPDRPMLVEVAQRLGKKIDSVATKGAAP